MSDEYEKWWEDYEKAEQIVHFISYRKPYLKRVGRDAYNACAERFSELIAACKLWPRSHTDDKETKVYIARIQTEIVKLEEGEWKQ